jgi:Methyltransferase domain
LADHGAGKSYLGFILYDLFFKVRSAGRVYGVESRPELVEKSLSLAARLGFDRMGFLATTVQQALHHPDLPEHIDVVTALHACDTATDDAIAFGLAKNARCLVLVPCCQAEVASVLRQNKAFSLARTPLAELWRHPLHTREFGSQITNVLRCLQLEAHGYSVTVTELVGWEHSMKNELILARRTDGPRSGTAQQQARERLLSLVDALGLKTLTDRFAVP